MNTKTPIRFKAIVKTDAEKAKQSIEKLLDIKCGTSNLHHGFSTPVVFGEMNVEQAREIFGAEIVVEPKTVAQTIRPSVPYSTGVMQLYDENMQAYEITMTRLPRIPSKLEKHFEGIEMTTGAFYARRN
ncbi:hypothetical protein HY837_05240 [archaeon]|nr:hypothetical protein [archaeon]